MYRFYLLYCLFLCLGNILFAQTTGFEKGVPQSFCTVQSNELSSSEEFYKEGKRSLAWQFSPRSVLTVKLDTPLHLDSISKEKRGITLWIYNEQARKDSLRFEFFSPTGHVSYRFGFRLNAQGWRACWIGFAHMKGDKQENTIAGYRIVAPDNNGRVFFDRLVFPVKEMNQRTTPDMQMPYNNSLTFRDLWHWCRVWQWEQLEYDLPLPATLTPTEKQELQTIEERLTKVLTADKVSQGKIDKAYATFQKAQIQRSGNGFTGAPLVVPDDKLNRKKGEIETDRKRLENQQQGLARREEELKELEAKEREKLEAISGLSADEARERLVESLKDEAKTNAASYINEIMDEAKLTANKEAKRIVIQSIQRVATETAIENSVTVFHIDNDEVKGRIIGREGRNIRALEAATGVEIVVDDTPEAIVISAFDPVRREICRLALHQLVADGRIHPARIEEVVAKVTKQVEEEIIETGKRTAIDLGIHGLHPELVRIVGKMKYRSSYGQNLLQHARETANLCAVMASELGLNPKKAKRAGLLHDIGKVPDEEPELPHAIYGAKLAEKYKEKPDICNAIGAHHDEMEMTSLLAPIVQVCDAISGARPGARREIVEAYIKRLNDLENIAMSYPGVTKTYAIQAGRELRVIVGADKIDDKQTESLSGEIAKKIQDEMTYPGQVKITVIRETRSVSYAK